VSAAIIAVDMRKRKRDKEKPRVSCPSRTLAVEDLTTLVAEAGGNNIVPVDYDRIIG
jgi:hypothetical protein